MQLQVELARCAPFAFWPSPVIALGSKQHTIEWRQEGNLEKEKEKGNWNEFGGGEWEVEYITQTLNNWDSIECPKGIQSLSLLAKSTPRLGFTALHEVTLTLVTISFLPIICLSCAYFCLHTFSHEMSSKRILSVPPPAPAMPSSSHLLFRKLNLLCWT